MNQFSVYNNNPQKRKISKLLWLQLLWCYDNGLWGIKKVLLPLNEQGDSSFLFQNLCSCDIKNQYAKFHKNLSAVSISVEWLVINVLFRNKYKTKKCREQ